MASLMRQALLPEGFREVEYYPLNPPHAYALIAEDVKTGEVVYLIDETKLSPTEERVYKRILSIMEYELRLPEEVKKPHEFFLESAKNTIKKYGLEKKEKLSPKSWDKIIYYIVRDIGGFGPIDPLMRDPNIEDISCIGVNKPVYLWHRRYESIRSNLTFTTDEDLDNFIVKLIHIAGKHISTAFPVVDCILPGGHRLSSCFRKEVTAFGTSFTIRKFREDPYTIIDFINMGTIDADLAAYLWLCMENRLSVIIIGGVGSGKTTALNAVACLIKPGSKIITCEEVAETNLPHENWMPLTTRESYGLGAERTGEITLFDLVKSSLRHRPDYILVGEVRGAEGFVLFQSMAVGHGGLSTFHAEDLDSAIKRLTAPPINIAPQYIPLMNLALTIIRTKIRKGETDIIVRRIKECHEIIDYGYYVSVYEWDPTKDTFINRLDRSKMLERIMERNAWTKKYCMEELERRKIVLTWMARKNLRSVKDVGRIVGEYHKRPKEVFEKARKELRIKLA